MSFTAELEIIGINPFVHVPAEILADIFKSAGKDKGPIPVKGEVNGKAYLQNLMKFKGAWRLYINTAMLKNSPGRTGETLKISIAFDPAPRITPMHPRLEAALKANPDALQTFESLTPSRKKEIVRYIAFLKSEDSVNRNIERAIRFLQGQDRFVGRDKP